MKNNSYLKVVRLGGWYDLVLTVGFSTPWTALLMLEMLKGLALFLQLPGTLEQPGPAGLLFISLFGSIVTVWSLLRILRPEAHLGLADGAARFLFSLWFLLAPMLLGASFVAWLFLAPELVFGFVQVVGFFLRSQEGNEAAATQPL